MHIKNNSTDELIKMSENIREEITHDILDVFGIDLSNRQPVHHSKTKPVWTQQIRDNNSLKKELDSFVNLVEKNLERLPEMMQFEKEHKLLIVENFFQDSITHDLEFIWICESHVQKFERDVFLTKKEIAKYHVRIQELKNKIKNITCSESFQNLPDIDLA